MRKEILLAARQVLAEAFRPVRRTSGGALDAKDVVDMILRWFSVPTLSVIGLGIQSSIPGVKNLYPWAFPLIVANVALAVLIFVAAVRLQLPRNRAPIRLAELRKEGYEGRNAGTTFTDPENQLEPWIDGYHAWEEKVRVQLRLISPVDAQLWDTLGNVPQYYKGQNKVVRFLNFYTFQLTRLEDVIERLRQ